jgi:hypothetical protein
MVDNLKQFPIRKVVNNYLIGWYFILRKVGNHGFVVVRNRLKVARFWLLYILSLATYNLFTSRLSENQPI